MIYSKTQIDMTSYDLIFELEPKGNAVITVIWSFGILLMILELFSNVARDLGAPFQE